MITPTRLLKSAICSSLLAIFATANVQAVPVLQLYVDGATYNTEHESWVFDAVIGESFTLWVIGNVDGPGGQGTIFDVKLSAVYIDPDVGDGGNRLLRHGPELATGCPLGLLPDR